MTTIYVRLLNEGTEVCRPASGFPLEDNLFEIMPTPDYDPSDETWEFLPGAIVETQKRHACDGEYLVAVKQVHSHQAR